MLVLGICLACGGAGTPKRRPAEEMQARRMEMAKKLAKTPPIRGVAPLLTPWSEAYGQPITKLDMANGALEGRPTRLPPGEVVFAGVVSRDDDVLAQFGNIVPFAYIKEERDLNSSDLLIQYHNQLQSVDCKRTKDWLIATYGPPFGGGSQLAWDGVYQIIRVNSFGHMCMFEWSFWPPDEMEVGAYAGAYEEPVNFHPVKIDPSQRAAYLTTWHEAAERLFRGEDLGGIVASIRAASTLDDDHKARLIEALEAYGPQ